MSALSERLARVDSDIASDVRCHLENDLARRIDEEFGPAVNGHDVVDAVAFRLLSRLSPIELVRLAEETDAVEALARAIRDLAEERRRRWENVVPFRRKEV